MANTLSTPQFCSTGVNTLTEVRSPKSKKRLVWIALAVVSVVAAAWQYSRYSTQRDLYGKWTAGGDVMEIRPDGFVDSFFVGNGPEIDFTTYGAPPRWRLKSNRLQVVFNDSTGLEYMLSTFKETFSLVQSSVVFTAELIKVDATHLILRTKEGVYVFERAPDDAVPRVVRPVRKGPSEDGPDLSRFNRPGPVVVLCV